MHPYLISLILGIVEGLTEFLPVSSTAHLRIAEHLMGLADSDPYWKMYTIVIQLGAIAALPVYFWPRIMKFISTFPRGERGDRTILTHPLSLTMIAFVVTAGPAFLLAKVIGKNLENFKVIALALLIGGIVMAVIDVIFTRKEPAAVEAATGGEFHTTPRMEEMNLVQAIWIGACQILSAVFPGTSRSMSTIAAGQVAGLTRATALEFSFFLSMPTMAAAVGYDFLKTVILHKGEDHTTLPPVHLDAQGWITLAIGMVLSFVVALVVVHLFMAWVRKRGFVPFAIYRIIVGGVLLYFVLYQGFGSTLP